VVTVAQRDSQSLLLSLLPAIYSNPFTFQINGRKCSGADASYHPGADRTLRLSS